MFGGTAVHILEINGVEYVTLEEHNKAMANQADRLTWTVNQARKPNIVLPLTKAALEGYIRNGRFDVQG